MNRTLPVRGDVKQKNQFEVLNYLRVYGSQPRIDIAAHIKLTKAAVTSLTNEMIQTGVLVERGELQSEAQRHQRGRRKVMLDINENYRLVFGVTISDNCLRIGLTNLRGEVLSKMATPLTTQSYRELLELIVAQIQQFLKDNCLTMERILGAGLCMNSRTQCCVEGASAEEKLTRLKKDLSRALSIQLVTTTTCVGAVIAQKLLADRKIESILLCRFGYEQGCATLANGRIYRGATASAGGFEPLLRNCNATSYSEFLEQPGTAEGKNQPLNRNLAEIIALCATVMDPEKIVVFGDYFELPESVAQINHYLADNGLGRFIVEEAVLKEQTLFLAGCAAAIAHCFYKREF